MNNMINDETKKMMIESIEKGELTFDLKNPSKLDLDKITHQLQEVGKNIELDLGVVDAQFGAVKTIDDNLKSVNSFIDYDETSRNVPHQPFPHQEDQENKAHQAQTAIQEMKKHDNLHSDIDETSTALYNASVHLFEASRLFESIGVRSVAQILASTAHLTLASVEDNMQGKEPVLKKPSEEDIDNILNSIMGLDLQSPKEL